MKKRELHTLAELSTHLSTFLDYVFSRKGLGTRTLLLSDPTTIPAGLTRRTGRATPQDCCYIPGKQTWYVTAVKRNVTTDKLWINGTHHGWVTDKAGPCQ